MGIAVDEERGLALRLQWMNTPKRYRGELTPISAW